MYFSKLYPLLILAYGFDRTTSRFKFTNLYNLLNTKNILLALIPDPVFISFSIFTIVSVYSNFVYLLFVIKRIKFRRNILRNTVIPTDLSIPGLLTDGKSRKREAKTKMY